MQEVACLTEDAQDQHPQAAETEGVLALALAIFLERLKIQYTLKVFAKSGEKTIVKAMDAIQMFTCPCARREEGREEKGGKGKGREGREGRQGGEGGEGRGG